MTLTDQKQDSQGRSDNSDQEPPDSGKLSADRAKEEERRKEETGEENAA